MWPSRYIKLNKNHRLNRWLTLSISRPYVNEDTINSTLGDFPLLSIYDGKRISRQAADSIRHKEGKNLRNSTLSGEEAYKAFGPAGIKGVIIMKSKFRR